MAVSPVAMHRKTPSVQHLPFFLPSACPGLPSLSFILPFACPGLALLSLQSDYCTLEPCRYHKLHVLFSGFWWKDRRPAPDKLFCSYKRIPREAKGMLER